MQRRGFLKLTSLVLPTAVAAEELKEDRDQRDREEGEEPGSELKIAGGCTTWHCAGGDVVIKTGTSD